jgi:WD40 repeat protein
LASCGFDKRVNIWQEIKEEGKITYTSRAKIQDFGDSVEDISFSPRVHGLKLAATTLNGKMKIFEPTDYASNINW